MRRLPFRVNINSKWAERLKQFPFALVFGGVAAAVVIFLTFRVLAQWSSILTSVIPDREVTIEEPANMPVKSSADESMPRQTLKAEKTASAVPEAKTVPQAAVAPKKFYAIQVVVYEDHGMAERLVAELEKKKLVAFSKETTSRRGKKIYEVFVGRFATAEEADKKLAEYRKKNYLKDFQDSFIRPRFE